jgi:diguanylate cyclase (GGDEF)-like protein
LSTDLASAAAFRVLATSASLLARGEDIDAAVGAILAATAEATDAEVAAVFLVEPGGESLQLGAVHGMSDGAAAALEAAVTSDPDHPIARAARDVARSIGRRGTAADGATMTGADLPLVVARDGIDLALGVVTFGWSVERRIDEAEATVLAAAADLIATAMDRARLTSLVHERSEWLERLAQSDPLTGLANLRTFGRVLELEIARAGRQGGDVSVAVFDVDDFTEVNEAAGRNAGDDALRRVAEVLGGSVRLVDTIARTGGDEFAVIAPGSAGATVAQRVIDGVAGATGTDGSAISVSAGVARFPADGTTADELLGAARAALDAARTSGRGRLGAASGGPRR